MAYKLRHKESGYFLGKSINKAEHNPYRSYKTNLRIRGGSIYEYIPTDAQMKNWYRNYYNLVGDIVEFDYSDFEIITI